MDFFLEINNANFEFCNEQIHLYLIGYTCGADCHSFLYYCKKFGLLKFFAIETQVKNLKFVFGDAENNYNIDSLLKIIDSQHILNKIPPPPPPPEFSEK